MSQAIADRLGFDDLIATNSIIGIDARVTAKIDGENCLWPGEAADDRGVDGA